MGQARAEGISGEDKGSPSLGVGEGEGASGNHEIALPAHRPRRRDPATGGGCNRPAWPSESDTARCYPSRSIARIARSPERHRPRSDPRQSRAGGQGSQRLWKGPPAQLLPASPAAGVFPSLNKQRSTPPAHRPQERAAAKPSPGKVTTEPGLERSGQGAWPNPKESGKASLQRCHLS